jgi:hypothetical protein
LPLLFKVKIKIGEAFCLVYSSVAQPFYTRGTPNIVEEAWRHTNLIWHIVGLGGRWFTALIGRDNFFY